MTGSNLVIENKEELRRLFGSVWELYDLIPENLRGTARKLIDKWLNDELEYDELVMKLRMLAAANSYSVAEVEHS